jgi:hypothetical protein
MHAQSLQWLRTEGADWPVVLGYDEYQWPDDMIAWCRCEGCDSPVKVNLEQDVDNDEFADHI